MRNFWDKTPYSPGGGGGPGGVLPLGIDIGDILFWDGSAWVANAVPPAPGNTLVWNGTKWIPIALPGGVLPPGVELGDILVWDGVSAWVPNALPPAVGDTLVWNGATWVPTVQGAPGGGLPPGLFAGDILVWTGAAWVRDFTLPFLTQAAWFVNSATGNDANDGSTALTPLLTIGELNRRFMGRTFSPALTSITVTLAGTFPTQDLVLFANWSCAGTAFTGGGQMNIQGTMTQVGAGTITGYTAENAATGTRTQLVDAAQNFGPHVNRRIRMTSGTNAGAVTFITSSPGATTANVGTFQLIAPVVFAGSVSNVNPAIGDSYVIETFDTQLQAFNVQILGNCIYRLRDVSIGSAANTIIPHSYMLGGRASVAQVFGAQFIQVAGGTHIVEGTFNLNGVQVIGGSSFSFGKGNFFCQGVCQCTEMQTLEGADIISNRWLQDGNGVNNAAFLLGNGSSLEDINPRACFGVVNGFLTELMRVEDFAMWVMSTSGAIFYGAAGNTVTNALRVRNGCGVMYVTKPTATGATPGLDVVLAGAAAIDWATAPAVAAPPNNAFINVRQ